MAAKTSLISKIKYCFLLVKIIFNVKYENMIEKVWVFFCVFFFFFRVCVCVGIYIKAP